MQGAVESTWIRAVIRNSVFVVKYIGDDRRNLVVNGDKSNKPPIRWDALCSRVLCALSYQYDLALGDRRY